MIRPLVHPALGMRYQGASADSMPTSNGKKTHVKLCKKEENLENGRILNGGHPSSLLEGKAVRTKGGSSTSSNGNHHKALEYVNSISESFREKASEDRKTSPENQPSRNRDSERGGDVIPQWGQNKRSRGYRAEYKNVVEKSSSQAKKIIRIDRRNGRHDQQALSAQAQLAVHSRSTSLRPCTPVRDPYIPCLNNRNSEDPAASGNGATVRNKGLSSEGRMFHKKSDGPSPKSPEKADKSDTVRLQTNRGLGDGVPLEPTPTPSEMDAFANVEKLNLDMFEWPKIYVSLSRKEKEDDFLAIKGGKLPQRPKKRAKNVDKTLQYCFPGNWLSDLTRARYEVREKKSTKKKPRGLKAMEILDSDSE